MSTFGNTEQTENGIQNQQITDSLNPINSPEQKDDSKREDKPNTDNKNKEKHTNNKTDGSTVDESKAEVKPASTPVVPSEAKQSDNDPEHGLTDDSKKEDKPNTDSEKHTNNQTDGSTVDESTAEVKPARTPVVASEVKQADSDPEHSPEQKDDSKREDKPNTDSKNKEKRTNNKTDGSAVDESKAEVKPASTPVVPSEAKQSDNDPEHGLTDDSKKEDKPNTDSEKHTNNQTDGSTVDESTAEVKPARTPVVASEVKQADSDPEHGLTDDSKKEDKPNTDSKNKEKHTNNQTDGSTVWESTTEVEPASTPVVASELKQTEAPRSAANPEAKDTRKKEVEDRQGWKQIPGPGSQVTEPDIQKEKIITVSKELILIIIMTSTIIATIVALVPVLYLWSDNYKVNQELYQLQTQLADVNKRLHIPNHVGSDKKDDVPQPVPSDLAEEISETKKRLNAAEIQLGQCISTTSDIVKEIKGTKFNLSEAINKTQMEAWRNLTRDREETTKYISSNFMSYAKWFPIIGTGLIVEILMVVFGVYLYSRWANRHHEPHTGTVNHEHPRRQNGVIDDPQTQNKTQNKVDEFQGMKWVLSRIKGKKLHNKVCVISFYQETSEKHVQLTRSAMESIDAFQNVEVEPVVINKHGELLEIPACKIFIMYVDYNQRNVILEDTKKVLGDLKLTTARAIQKFNADLILVYVGHKESRELRAEDLYNTDITSVQLHPDLKEISHKKRFLSTYKQFTTFQKEHINKILKNKLL